MRAISLKVISSALMLLMGVLISTSTSAAEVISQIKDQKNTNQSQFLKGEWGLEFKDIGKIALSCYYNKRVCKLYWVFSELRATYAINDGTVTFYIDNNKETYLSISLKGGQPYKFLPGGVLSEKYYTDYKTLEFKNLKHARIGSYTDITDFRRNDKYYVLYNVKGRKKELPKSLPSWLMNPTAYLYRHEKTGASIGFRRVLEHPALSAETLGYMYSLFNIDTDPYPDKLISIAKNPSASKDTLEELFGINNKPRIQLNIWNAVANNPNAPSSYKGEFYEKIKNGSKDMHNRITRDINTSSEMIDWIARNGDYPFGRSGAIYTHRNALPDTLEYLFDHKSSDGDKIDIITNKNVNNNTLLKAALYKISNRSSQQVMLNQIIRYKDKGKEAVKVAIDRLVRANVVSYKNSVARDPRLTNEHIKILMNFDEPSIRRTLSENKALSYEDLIVLANDEYASVSKFARRQLRRHHKKKYAKVKSTLPELSTLNQSATLHHELNMHVRNGDLVAAKKIMQRLENTFQSVEMNIGFALESGDEDIIKFILDSWQELPLERVTFKFKSLLSNKHFNEEWLSYLLETGSIKSVDHFTALQYCYLAKRLDYAQLLIDNGYSINAKPPASTIKQDPLQNAIFTRDSELLDFLIDNKVNINTAQRAKLVTQAKKLRYSYAVEVLDVEDEHNDFIVEFKRKYAPDKESKLIGSWSNLEDGFKQHNIKLNDDGSGLITGAVSGALIVWKEIADNSLTLIPNSNGTYDEAKALRYMYKINANGEQLEINADGKKSAIYYRVDYTTASELMRKTDRNIDKRYVGTWADDKRKYKFKINEDGTAVYNEKYDYVCKKTAGNILVAYSVTKDSINHKHSLVLSLVEDGIKASAGTKSIYLKRISIDQIESE